MELKRHSFDAFYTMYSIIRAFVLVFMRINHVDVFVLLLNMLTIKIAYTRDWGSESVCQWEHSLCYFVVVGSEWCVQLSFTIYIVCGIMENDTRVRHEIDKIGWGVCFPSTIVRVSLSSNRSPLLRFMVQYSFHSPACINTLPLLSQPVSYMK